MHDILIIHVNHNKAKQSKKTPQTCAHLTGPNVWWTLKRTQPILVGIYVTGLHRKSDWLHRRIIAMESTRSIDNANWDAMQFEMEFPESIFHSQFYMYASGWWKTGCPQTLQWRHNERNVVSNRQPHDCLLNRLFRRRSKKTSKLRVTVLCEGNSPVTGKP